MKLKPCPFCGENEDGGVHIILNAHLNGIERYAVMCEGCGVETYGYKTQEEAIECWNTRVEPVKRGKWVSDIAGVVRCSACKHQAYFLRGYEFFDYCPFCGAKMVGEPNGTG